MQIRNMWFQKKGHHGHVPNLAVLETRYSKTEVSLHVNAYGTRDGEKMKSGK